MTQGRSNLYAAGHLKGQGQHVQPRKNAGTSVDQIKRFYARNLPVSTELE